MKYILQAANISSSFSDWLQLKGYELLKVDHRDQLVNIDRQLIEGVITSNKLILDRTILPSFKNLRWIARLGSGMEIIDTTYCEQAGIHCFSSPAGIANAVGEHVSGMLLSLMHRIHSSYTEVKQGQWKRESNRGVELEGLTLGIIGYGHTGSAVAGKLKVFVDRVLAYDKYRQGFGGAGITEVTLENLQREADIISFHVPFNEETLNYYNEVFKARMRKPHILINASRGQVVDEEAVLRGLQVGKITGACLDVLANEQEMPSLLKDPQSSVSRLLQHNVLITPHIAGYTFNAIEKMSEELRRQLEGVLG